MNNRRVTYYPPDAQVIQQFAREVCKQLAQSGNADYNQPEVVSGFADYLIFAAAIIAKGLNEGHDDLLDKPSEQG